MATLQTNFNGVLRNMTETEIEEYKATIDAAQAEAVAVAEAAAAKVAARQAVVDKLGLTADEAAALFG